MRLRASTAFQKEDFEQSTAVGADIVLSPTSFSANGIFSMAGVGGGTIEYRGKRGYLKGCRGTHGLCRRTGGLTTTLPSFSTYRPCIVLFFQESHFVASAQCSKDDAKLNAQHILQKASSLFPCALVRENGRSGQSQALALLSRVGVKAAARLPCECRV